MVRPLERALLVADPALAGLPLCRAYSDHVDAWLADLFAEVAHAARASRWSRSAATAGPSCRPQSDIDLLLLHRPEVDVGALAERLWYPIWDEGLKLGHSVRTAEGGAGAGLGRPRHRHLAAVDAPPRRRRRADRRAGRQGAGAVAQAGQAVAGRDSADGCEERHERAGEVAFLLEPDLKEGRGGLRDVHAIALGRAWPSRSCSRATTRSLAAAYDVLLVGAGRAAPAHRAPRRPAACCRSRTASPRRSATPTPTS